MPLCGDRGGGGGVLLSTHAENRKFLECRSHAVNEIRLIGLVLVRQGQEEWARVSE